MKIHEYQAKEIFSKYGIPVERHTLCCTAAGVVAAFRTIGTDKVVIKAQVLTGGRGKAGGVKVVDNMEDAYQEAKNILGMSIKGLPVNQVLVSEAIDIAAEYYVGFTIDRNTRSVVLMMSALLEYYRTRTNVINPNLSLVDVTYSDADLSKANYAGPFFQW